MARANAARALGSAADMKAFDLLVKSATEDIDLRVRVSAMSALGGLRNPKAADKLIERGEKLLFGYKSSKFAHPAEQNELITIATVLGRLISDSGICGGANACQAGRFYHLADGAENKLGFVHDRSSRRRACRNVSKNGRGAENAGLSSDPAAAYGR
jgi:hypothetical protein